MVSTGQNDVSEEDSRGEEQPTMVENAVVVPEIVHQPEEKIPAKAVGNSVDVSNNKMDKPISYEIQSKASAISSDENKISRTLASANVQKQSAVILTANATQAKALPSLGGDGCESFPECRVYYVNSINTDLKEIYDKFDSLSSLAAFYDKDGTKFNLQKSMVDKNTEYNLIVWDGYINIKKASVYTFLLAWVIPFSNEHATEGSTVLQVNDKKVLIGPTYSGNTCQGILDIDMKVGLNRLRLCILTRDNMSLLKPSTPVIRYKLKNAVGDYREITPANLYHKIMEEDW